MESNPIEEIRIKNGSLFEGYFKKVFGDAFEIKCDWGFPELRLEIANISEEKETVWVLDINVSKRTYKLQTRAAKKENEVWVADVAVIDGNTINYIVNSSVELSNRIFGITPTESKESEETKKVE